MKFNIDPDIRIAETLPAEFYRSSEVYDELKKKVFASSWQFVCDTDRVKIPGSIFPFTMLEGYLNEPLLLTRDHEDTLHCLSNVCTHRGNILVENPDVVNNMKCRYHGRRFELNGCFRSMPECEDALNFPRPEDNLSKVPFGIWNKLIFASIAPRHPLQSVFKSLEDSLEGVTMTEMTYEPSRSRDYLVKCNWALYVENYLEGFHIPYVHSSLNEVIDYGSYSTEIYEHGNLQLGIAKPGEVCFSMSETSPYYGSEIAAFYWWIFPNLMLNFYPWGLSINV
nr:aromatic ring-hydroxylating dioxygenase subunit alpha [Ignavibacteria bacterium]